MRGRPPKPTALAELHGRPSHKPKAVLDGRAAIEASVPRGRLVPPDDFTDEQRAIWDYAVANATPSMLRLIDQSALIAWTVAADLHRRARVMLNKSPLLVRPTSDPESKSLAVQNPLLAIVNRQALLMLRAAEQLGFTPVSRPRLYSGVPLPPEVPAPMPQPAGGRRQKRAPQLDEMSLDEFLETRPSMH